MKRHSKKFRLLKEDLRYWQGRYKIELRGVKETRAKIKRIGRMMTKEIDSRTDVSAKISKPKGPSPMLLIIPFGVVLFGLLTDWWITLLLSIFALLVVARWWKIVAAYYIGRHIFGLGRKEALLFIGDDGVLYIRDL